MRGRGGKYVRKTASLTKKQLVWLLVNAGLAALALLAAGCTLHMRLRNRFIDQL